MNVLSVSKKFQLFTLIKEHTLHALKFLKSLGTDISQFNLIKILQLNWENLYFFQISNPKLQLVFLFIIHVHHIEEKTHAIYTEKKSLNAYTHTHTHT